MFTTEYRDQVRQCVLELGRADPRVTAGAFTGSMAFGAGDSWSDIDIAFGINDDISPETVLDEWMQILDQEPGIVDFFDLRSGSSIYRVFLLPSGLEVDVAVTPAKDFGARGPQFRTLFGTTQQVQANSQPEASHLIGLCWHHVLHTRSCIERHKPWRAEYWMSEMRNHILALGCLRLGENALNGRGIDLLPTSVSAPLLDTLVHSLDESELRRALASTTRYFIRELEEWNPTLCARLKPILLEFGAP